jgi:hypothetical protein
MKRTAKWFCLFALAAIFSVVSGCSTNEPQNASARPWNAPQSWEGGLPVDMGQHP